MPNHTVAISQDNRHQTPSSVGVWYSVVSTGLAFFVWGGWAYFVNSRSLHEDHASPIVSALIQGCGSSLVTLVMLKSVTTLYHRLSHHAWQLVLPPMITTSVTGTCMTGAHLLAGTADPATTIVPGLVVSLIFNLVTTIKLRKQEQK